MTSGKIVDYACQEYAASHMYIRHPCLSLCSGFAQLVSYHTTDVSVLATGAPAPLSTHSVGPLLWLVPVGLCATMGNADSKAGIRRAVISLCSQPLNEEQPAWDAFWIDTTAEVRTCVHIVVVYGCTHRPVVCGACGLLTTSQSRQDVFESISMEDVRTMLRRQPRNLVLLIRKVRRLVTRSPMVPVAFSSLPTAHVHMCPSAWLCGRQIVAILEALCANPDPKHFPVTMTAVRTCARTLVPVCCNTCFLQGHLALLLGLL